MVNRAIAASGNFAGRLRLPASTNILKRKPLSAVICLKIARLFGGSPELWVRLQATYDLKKSEQNKKIMARVARIVPLAAEIGVPRFSDE
jgi:plasmid maintenance system antidote protein VapI